MFQNNKKTVLFTFLHLSVFPKLNSKTKKYKTRKKKLFLKSKKPANSDLIISKSTLMILHLFNTKTADTRKIQ